MATQDQTISPEAQAGSAGHEPVASPQVAASTPNAGPDGDERAHPMERTIAEPQNQSAAAGPLLDAYWASHDDPPTRRGPSDIADETIHGADDRIEITATNVYPWRAVASLIITAQDGTQWSGTAWFVSPRMLVTAGHNLYMHARGGWPTQVEVIPGRQGANPAPFGSVICTAYRSTQGWVRDENGDYDYGALLLPENARLGDQTGWFGYEARADNALQHQTVNLVGYPGDKPAGTLWYHSNLVSRTNALSFDYEIDTWWGQSGAPVYVYVEGRGRHGVGIHVRGSAAGNSATRITNEVITNLNAWKAEVP